MTFPGQVRSWPARFGVFIEAFAHLDGQIVITGQY